MRLALVSLALVAAAMAAMLAGNPERGTPLWPGARHTVEERDRAVIRGLEFMYRFARQPDTFSDWGHDLLSAFYNIAVTSGDAELRRIAWGMGRERALAWRRLHSDVPPESGPDEVTDLIWGLDAAERFGVPDPRLREALRRAAARFTVVDYLGFDPAVEPPPADLPKPCAKCGRQNARGATVCARCGSKLDIFNRYALFQDALIDTFSCDQAGISLGVRYRDVLHWLPAMRPWPVRKPGNDDDYYGGVYAITHVIYTYNEYSRFRVSRACFPDEFEHLRDNLQQAVREKDPETMGEYLDTLRSFGLTFEDDMIRKGFDYLLSVQNPDGSWGDLNDKNPYGRYHPTWTSVDGLRDYRWTRVLPCPVF
ncbi:MAG TPA: hypothetical protein VE959_02845 [Bryobacteraceae bacterium]|nr:hypothetical protein [Bryobacteraceae bacterium]